VWLGVGYVEWGYSTSCARIKFQPNILLINSIYLQSSWSTFLHNGGRFIWDGIDMKLEYLYEVMKEIHMRVCFLEVHGYIGVYVWSYGRATHTCFFYIGSWIYLYWACEVGHSRNQAKFLSAWWRWGILVESKICMIYVGSIFVCFSL